MVVQEFFLEHYLPYCFQVSFGCWQTSVGKTNTRNNLKLKVNRKYTNFIRTCTRLNFFFVCFCFGNSQTSKNIPFGGHARDHFLNRAYFLNLVIPSEVLLLVNLSNFITYDWTIKYEWKVTGEVTPNGDVCV